jgi:hypothetical protein
MENGKKLKASYRDMSAEFAKRLIFDFENDGHKRHRDLVLLATRNKEISLAMRYACKSTCLYIINVYVPCYGEIEYFFKSNEDKPNIKFDFVREQELSDICCYPGLKRSWWRRLLNM